MRGFQTTDIPRSFQSTLYKSTSPFAQSEHSYAPGRTTSNETKVTDRLSLGYRIIAEPFNFTSFYHSIKNETSSDEDAKIVEYK